MSTAVLERRYSPRGAAQELMRHRDTELLISGPAGTGKSRAVLEKLHLMCLVNSGMRGLIVRKTATSLTSSALVTWRRFVATEAIQQGIVTYYGGSAEEPAQYRYQNGSVIVLGGMDRATRIMSTEYDFIFVQEATELTEEDWEVLTTRLRNWKVSFQQIVGDCNPAQPTHWLKRRADDGRVVLLASRHEDNPMLFDDEGVVTERGRDYIKRLDELSGVRKLRLRDGQWAAAEGMIYSDFGTAHLVDEMPEGWEAYSRIWGVDFGFTNPFVCQQWAIDPDGRLWLYREQNVTHS